MQGLSCALIVAAKVVAARGNYGLAVDLGTTTIAVYPYEPQFVEEKRFLSESIGLRFNPKAEVRTLPLIKRKLSYHLHASVISYKSRLNCIAPHTCSNLSVDSVVINDPIFPFDTV